MDVVNNNSTAFPAVFHEVVLTVKIVGGVTSLLSILGCLVIIFTYVVFKDLRTTARQLLVNLSVADILVSGSHFLGLYTNYQRFLSDYEYAYNASVHDPWCVTQGAVSIMGTLSSFLWTMAIAFYLVVIIVFRSARAGKCVVVLSYILCWGVPIAPVVVSVVQKFIGFHPLADTGWCYTADLRELNFTYSTIHCDTLKEKHGFTDNIVSIVFGYEIWVYIAFLTLPILYTTLFCYMRFKLYKNRNTPKAAKMDIKLFCIPVIFFLLRTWSLVIDAYTFYPHPCTTVKFAHSKKAAVLLVFSAIGDNAQGLANAILFCLFTKQVRHKLLHSLKRCRQGSYCCTDENEAYVIEKTTTGLEETSSVQIQNTHAESGESTTSFLGPVKSLPKRIRTTLTRSKDKEKLIQKHSKQNIYGPAT